MRTPSTPIYREDLIENLRSAASKELERPRVSGDAKMVRFLEQELLRIDKMEAKWCPTLTPHTPRPS